MRALVLLALGACSLPDGDYFGRVPAEIDPAHFRWCNQGEPDHLDPVMSTSTASSPLVAQMFDALTTYGADGLPTASLATRWESSPDLRTFTFHLRDDARWSNGRAVTAYDVAYSVIRVSNPITASPNADVLAPIENASALLAREVLVDRAGTIVRADGPVPDVNARTSTKILALRDLGAAPDAAYARVPAGAEVTIIMTSGGKATLPSPPDGPWAYVFWHRDLEGVMGWVPLAELDGAPNAGAEIRAGGRALRGADVLFSPDALGMRVIDAHTIEFHCADPTPFFLALTDNRAMRTTPIEAVSRWPRHWDRPDHVVTSGPFHLTLWKERDRVELVRSPTFWGRAQMKIERFTAFSMDDQAASANTYYTGGCDATASNNIPSTYIPAINGEQRGGRAYKDYDVSPYLGIYFVWINTKKVPNRHLRRAMSYAIDRTQIPRFTHGGEWPTAQLTPGAPIASLSDADLGACGVSRETKGVALVEATGELCYLPPPGLDYDVAAARRELAAARAEGGVPNHPLEYRYNAGSEAHKQIAEYLQSAWQAIGLDVRIVSQEWNSMLDDTRKGDYELVRFGNIGTFADTESEFLPIFRCDSPDNRGKYCSPEFERLMTEARALQDRRARNAKLREAEAVMIEDAPLLPIYVYTQKHLVKPYVRGYAINLIDQPPLWQVWLDPDWNRR